MYISCLDVSRFHSLLFLAFKVEVKLMEGIVKSNLHMKKSVQGLNLKLGVQTEL